MVCIQPNGQTCCLQLRKTTHAVTDFCLNVTALQNELSLNLAQKWLRKA
jgi:hypothetical protein